MDGHNSVADFTQTAEILTVDSGGLGPLLPHARLVHQTDHSQPVVGHRLNFLSDLGLNGIADYIVIPLMISEKLLDGPWRGP